MIELTTGVVFLMSSLYGAGLHSYNPPGANDSDKDSAKKEESVTFTSGHITDPKLMEAYLRKVYADTPILVEIARCESEFRQFDKNGKLILGRVDNRDTGVMQINKGYHAETAEKLGIDVDTIDGNIAFAKYLYSKYGVQPWSASAPCWDKAGIARK